MNQYQRGATRQSRIGTSLNNRRLVEERKAIKEVDLGCRHLDVLSGCRCGKGTEGNTAFCNDHNHDAPETALGLFPSSLDMKLPR